MSSTSTFRSCALGDIPKWVQKHYYTGKLPEKRPTHLPIPTQIYI